MANSRTKRWNPKYLSGCVEHALGLLQAAGQPVDLLHDAARHLECTEKFECRFYRRELDQKAATLRRTRLIRPWEYWLLKAANQILQPIPGTKHSAVNMIRCALDEYDSEMGKKFAEWHWQHAVKEPAYV